MSPQTEHNSILTELDHLGQKYSMSHWGLSRLERPLSFEFYENWIKNESHGEMTYLKTHLPLKEDPKKFWPQAASALVFAVSYSPFPEKNKNLPLPALRRALYAQGEDYHFWFKAQLFEIQKELEILFPENHFLAMTDSSPVLERDLAARAGLGWFGKNTCLIHPKKGSLFLIGEIYSDLSLKIEQSPIPDFCGTCNRCIEICPTQALEKPKYLNANKCISYWTIESRLIPPTEIRHQFGDWFFGCDLCQTICPWNQKVFKNQLVTDLLSTPDSPDALIDQLRFVFTASGKQLQKTFQGTALLRAGPFGFRRNAMIVAANRKISELKPEIESYLKDPKLGELAAWAIQSIES